VYTAVVQPCERVRLRVVRASRRTPLSRLTDKRTESGARAAGRCWRRADDTTAIWWLKMS